MYCFICNFLTQNYCWETWFAKYETASCHKNHNRFENEIGGFHTHSCRSVQLERESLAISLKIDQLLWHLITWYIGEAGIVHRSKVSQESNITLKTINIYSNVNVRAHLLKMHGVFIPEADAFILKVLTIKRWGICLMNIHSMLLTSRALEQQFVWEQQRSWGTRLRHCWNTPQCFRFWLMSW